tara:strand:+ start:6682 stop:7140 length:459 start_codon:yes stop_codon:yes gene_type:complete
VKRRKKGTAKTKTSKQKALGKYKSSLEKTCANLLAESGLPFAYEEQEYVLMDKFRYEGVYWKMTPKSKGLVDKTNKVVLPIKYTPDFVAKDGSWIIETKGFIHSHHDFPMRWKLFLRYLSDIGSPLPKLFICRNKTQIQEAINIIKHNEEAN